MWNQFQIYMKPVLDSAVFCIWLVKLKPLMRMRIWNPSHACLWWSWQWVNHCCRLLYSETWRLHRTARTRELDDVTRHSCLWLAVHKGVCCLQCLCLPPGIVVTVERETRLAYFRCTVDYCLVFYVVVNSRCLVLSLRCISVNTVCQHQSADMHALNTWTCIHGPRNDFLVGVAKGQLLHNNI